MNKDRLIAKLKRHIAELESTIVIINIPESKMKRLDLYAVVRGFDGGGEHGSHKWWTAMGADFAQHIAKVGADAIAEAKAQGSKGGKLSAELWSEVDGVKLPSTNITGITDKSLSAFQRYAHKVEGEVIALGEHKAK